MFALSSNMFCVKSLLCGEMGCSIKRQVHLSAKDEMALNTDLDVYGRRQKVNLAVDTKT